MTWQRAAELLENREYEQVARLLREQQETVQRSGQMTLVIMLAAACQLCLTCRQFQADKKLHQIGLDKARRREEESRRQIRAVLTMLSHLASSDELAELETSPDYSIAEPATVGSKTSKPGEHSTLFQKVKHLLGLESTPIETDGESSASLEKAAAGSPMDVDQGMLAEQLEQFVASTLEELDMAKSGAGSEIAQGAEKDKVSELSEDVAQQKVPGEVNRLDDEPAALQFADAKLAETGNPPEKAPQSMPGGQAAPVSGQPRQTRLSSETTSQDRTSLVVYCLGPFRVYQHDRSLTDWDSLKSQQILKYLLVQKGKSVAKDVLMEVFWPDSEPEAARRNLHQAIYSLRQTLRRGDPNFQHILFEQDRYLLNPEMVLWLDFEEFQKHVQAGRRLEAVGQLAEAMAEYGVADGLYQGAFLEEDLYEDWCQWQRERLQNMYLDISNRLGKYYLRSGEYTAAMVICQKVLAQDICHEQAHFRLMRCYLAQHQRHLAVRQYQICEEALKTELDLDPSEETTALYRELTS